MARVSRNSGGGQGPSAGTGAVRMNQEANDALGGLAIRHDPAFFPPPAPAQAPGMSGISACRMIFF